MGLMCCSSMARGMDAMEAGPDMGYTRFLGALHAGGSAHPAPANQTSSKPRPGRSHRPCRRAGPRSSELCLWPTVGRCWRWDTKPYLLDRRQIVIVLKSELVPRDWGQFLAPLFMDCFKRKIWREFAKFHICLSLRKRKKKEAPRYFL